MWVTDPKVVKHMLKDSFEHITKPNPDNDLPFRTLKEFLGNGIFTLRHGPSVPAENAAWLLHRKTAAVIFTRSNFQNGMTQAFLAKGRRLVSVVSAQAGRVVDMQEHFFNFTMDSIMEIFFGCDCDTVSGQSNAYGAAFDKAQRHLVSYIFSAVPALTIANQLAWPFCGLNGIVAR